MRNNHACVPLSSIIGPRGIPRLYHESMWLRWPATLSSHGNFSPCIRLDICLPTPPPTRVPFLQLSQDRAEYRGYCERICDGDHFSVEDTLALQLERSGPQYTDLASDAIVGLASLSVTLTSRRRLAVNGTVESIGRWLATSMAYEGSGGDGGVGAGTGVRSKRWKGDREAIRNAVRLYF